MGCTEMWRSARVVSIQSATSTLRSWLSPLLTRLLFELSLARAVNTKQSSDQFHNLGDLTWQE
jgi:hypothetical protein